MLHVSPHADAEVQERLRWLNHLDDVPSEYRDLLHHLLDTLKKHWRERRLGLVAAASATKLQLIATAWIDATEHHASIQELAHLGGFALDIIESEHYAPAVPT